MSDVVIAGGGVGGLTAALRLRSVGHDVTILERNDVAGGKLATFERDGFTFDIGPSLLTLPHVFDDVFRLAGTSLADQVELVRLDPQFRYHWRNGGQLTVHDNADQTAAAFDTFEPGAGTSWREFNEHGRDIWEVAERTFFAGPMDNPVSLLKRMRSPQDLATIDALRTLNDAARSTFDSPELQQWAGRYATYSGSSPRRAPATLACIPHIEAEYGCWYVLGGLGELRDALVRVAKTNGVRIETGIDVTRITTVDGRATGVRIADGATRPADVIIANVDAEHLYGDLIDDAKALKQVRRAERSTSGFALCIGATGRTDDLGHHNVWFSDDYAQEFRELDAGKLATDPTIYACVSSVTDPTQAPSGQENWFLLVNTPPGVEIDAPAYRDLVLERLASHGVDLRERMQFCARLTPGDIEAFYRSPGGAIYGTSSNGKQAAFARPANRSPYAGLYLVGGSSHPGGGLPLVASSAKIVCNMIAEDTA